MIITTPSFTLSLSLSLPSLLSFPPPYPPSPSLFPDIYVCCVSFAHNVAAKDYYIAMVSTNVETANPEDELKPGLDLLGRIEKK